MRWCVAISHDVRTLTDVPGHIDPPADRNPQTYSGSKRTFTALLKTMIKKEKIAIVLALMRRNASPVFCAVLPQVCASIIADVCNMPSLGRDIVGGRLCGKQADRCAL